MSSNDNQASANGRNGNAIMSRLENETLLSNWPNFLVFRTRTQFNEH